MLAQSGVPVAATELGYRVAFAEALGAGLGATTYAPKDATATEVRALVDELLTTRGGAMPKKPPPVSLRKPPVAVDLDRAEAFVRSAEEPRNVRTPNPPDAKTPSRSDSHTSGRLNVEPSEHPDAGTARAPKHPATFSPRGGRSTAQKGSEERRGSK